MEFFHVFGNVILMAMFSLLFSYFAYHDFKKYGTIKGSLLSLGMVALTAGTSWVGLYPDAMRKAYSLGWFGTSNASGFFTAIAIMFGMVVVVIHGTVLGYYFTKDEAKE